MLRFNVTVWETVQALSEFQYILCYGSTSMTVLIDFEDKDFNTSYVTVQQLPKGKRKNGDLFQYILCYGSTNLSEMHLKSFSYFNTSYVTVQQRL